MGFVETCERLWGEMPVLKRAEFLEELATAIGRQPTWWDGLTPEAIARISSFDDLPSDLRGRLTLAVTDEGFSISEQARAQGIIQGEQTAKMVEEQATKRLPFHEAVVAFIPNAPPAHLGLLADLFKAIKIPAGHDAIISAWRARRADESYNLGVVEDLLAQKEEAEKEATEKAKKQTGAVAS